MLNFSQKFYKSLVKYKDLGFESVITEVRILIRIQEVNHGATGSVLGSTTLSCLV
jgi:hypothetical protein